MSAPADRLHSPPQTWVDTLARARADVAAGRVHELEDMLRDFEDDIAEIDDEARLQAEREQHGQARGPHTAR